MHRNLQGKISNFSENFTVTQCSNRRYWKHESRQSPESVPRCGRLISQRECPTIARSDRDFTRSIARVPLLKQKLQPRHGLQSVRAWTLPSGSRMIGRRASFAVPETPATDEAEISSSPFAQTAERAAMLPLPDLSGCTRNSPGRRAAARHATAHFATMQRATTTLRSAAMTATATTAQRRR